MSKDDLATPEPTTGSVNPWDASYEEMINAARSEGGLIEIESRELFKDKHQLMGVPFLITGIRYQEYDPTVEGARGYVSLEFTTESGINGVVNDGSTGIRRQVTKIMHKLGIIDVGTVVDDSSYDKGYHDWLKWPGMGEADNPDLIEALLDGRPLRIQCLRGLRVSSYPNPKNPSDTAETWYLS